MTWTGAELIVWGGIVNDVSSSIARNDGAAYNPGTDTWRVLPPAPIAARYAQGAAWTGTELIIWGGSACECRKFDRAAGTADPSVPGAAIPATVDARWRSPYVDGRARDGLG